MNEPPDASHRREERRLLPPWWTALFPLAVALGLAGWSTATAEEGGLRAFAAALLWPGGGAFLLVAVVVWLGWVLDID
jgi:hypothetical protein